MTIPAGPAPTISIRWPVLMRRILVYDGPQFETRATGRWPGRFLVKTLARGLVLVVALFSLTAPTLAQRPPVRSGPIRVAIITDGPTGRAPFSPDVIEREARNVLGTDPVLVLPPDKRFAGDWTRDGVNAALDRALADRQVDVVLAMGILAAHELAQRPTLPKPGISAVVIDPILQKFPLRQGTSARKNFTYVADFQNVG